MHRHAVVGLLVVAGLMAGTPNARAACIDVEKASAKELQALKGVGPAVAKAIVDYRKKMRTASTNAKAKRAVWNFKNWKTLLAVKGVGPELCANNVATLCFSGKVQKACPTAAKAKAKATPTKPVKAQKAKKAAKSAKK